METSAPKRRRTSPRTSVAVDPNNDTSTSTNDNTSISNNNAESNTTPREETPEPTPHNASPSKSPRRRRPDFASPTKASLARHNPDILARRRSEHEKRRASERLSRQSDERPAPLSRTPPEPTTMLAPENPAASRAASHESDVSLSDLLTARAEDPPRGVAGVPRRSPLKPPPIARPLPPPAPEGEELVDPFSRRPRIRRSDPMRVAEADAPPEPELPPTPSQLGMEDAAASTPPAGIHSESSPLKGRQPPRERKRARPPGSSPLKKGGPQAAVAEVGPMARSPVDLLANPQEVPRGQGPAGGAVRAHPARGIGPDDEVAEREAYLAALKEEEANLWSDLNLVAGLGRQWAEDGAASRLLPVVKKHPTLLRQPEEEKEDAAVNGGLKALLGGATDPSSWLLFANPAAQPPTTKKEGARGEGDTDLPEPISHRPVPMTASEELPFLQMFTPLTLTTSGAPLSRDDMTSYVRRHAISLCATDCPSLFSAQVSLVVDLADFSISDLRVSRLDPRAEPELAPYLDDLLTRTDRAASRNVALVCWAMGEWYRVAVKRAAFWRELHAEVGSGVVVENVGKLWKRKGAVGGRGEEAEGDEGLVAVKAGTAADLAPYMGTAAATVPLGFCGEGVVLRIEWRISFDWTGDAQAKVDLAVGVPGHWHKADPDGVLAGIPKVFDDIVRGTSNVKGAVRRVIALLADRG